MMPEVRVFPTTKALAAAAADHVANGATRAVSSHGRFTLVLSGGTTPACLYQQLATDPYRAAIPWDRVHIFWGDERCVPPDDAQSNYRMAREAFLDDLPIPPQQIHRMAGELPPVEAAARYAAELERFFGGAPSFDLVLLGMGTDGHTASLFPDSPALNEREQCVLSQYVPTLHAWRITLTPGALCAARDILFLVEGAAKAPTLRAVLEGPPAPERLPAQAIVQCSPQTHWFVDAEAAALLARGSTEG